MLSFWLCVGLIACVFVWLVETARRKDRDLSVEQQLASVDQVTGLANRAALLRDLGWALGSGVTTLAVSQPPFCPGGMWLSHRW